VDWVDWIGLDWTGLSGLVVLVVVHPASHSTCHILARHMTDHFRTLTLRFSMACHGICVYTSIWLYACAAGREIEFK